MLAGIGASRRTSIIGRACRGSVCPGGNSNSGEMLMSSLTQRDVPRIFSVCCLVILLVSTAARGQLYTGSVTGVVSDPSGAIVPNAMLKLVDEAKGFAFSATTDSM